jgi:hypothetical protein
MSDLVWFEKAVRLQVAYIHAYDELQTHLAQAPLPQQSEELDAVYRAITTEAQKRL